MQKLSKLNLDESQLLNNEHQQSILGGQRHRTRYTEDGGDHVHKDVWKDKNNNGHLDEGDVFKIKYMIVPLPPNDPQLPQFSEQAVMNSGVTAVWCDTCEDWDNASTSDDCCDL